MEFSNFRKIYVKRTINSIAFQYKIIYFFFKTYKKIKTPTQAEIDVAIGIIKKPNWSKKLKLIVTFKKTINDEIKNGIFVLSLAKNKFDNIFIRAKAINP